MNRHEIRRGAEQALSQKRSSLWHCQREKGKLKRENESLLRVVRAAEIAVVMNYDWNHAPTIQAFDNLAEALEALPEHLRCASGQ